MAVKVGINGFGRIGRNIMRAAMGDKSIDIVAVNDLTSAATLAHLLKYDSILGNLKADISAQGDRITVDRDEFQVLSVKDPAQLPWKSLGVDDRLRIDGHCSRIATTRRSTWTPGAKKVVITAPAKKPRHQRWCSASTAMPTTPRNTRSSRTRRARRTAWRRWPRCCTTSSRIRKGWMTTVHSYTNDQQLLDLPHKDLRRARAAALSIIPTTTGAAVAVGEVLPELKGRLDGISMRVPTPNVSVVDLAALLDKKTSKEEVNNAFLEASKGSLKGIMQYIDEPLVSIDFRGNPYSSIIDSQYTSVMDGDFVKVLAWYDNEWGYSSRCVDLLRFMDKKGL